MRKSMGKTPMSELLQKLTCSCFADRDALDVARTQAALWQTWLLPVTADTPVREDPGYHDDFLRIRDEMNKLSGADNRPYLPACRIPVDAGQVIVRIATYYIWARLHRDGERGLAGRTGAVRWAGGTLRYATAVLATGKPKNGAGVAGGEKMLDSLPTRRWQKRILRTLLLPNQLSVSFTAWLEDQHSPSLMPLINARWNHVWRSRAG